MKQQSHTILYIVLGVILLLFLANTGTTLRGYGGMMSGYSMMHIFGPLFMLLILTLIILAVFWLYQQVQKREK